MNNRTLVAGLAVLGVGLAVLPDAASARTGGVAVGGGRASFHGGIHRAAPRPFIRNMPNHFVRRAPFRHHAGKHFHHHRRFDNAPATVGVIEVPDQSDYPAFGVGPMADPSFTGSLLEQGAGADVASARSCKATTTMVPSESGGQVPVTVTRCRPLE
ncbi:MAG TPA: hypothetical protein VKE26_21750 [Xanthobacteraceae bacterium]|nr:hypothetical protein [Xanthobacteraceae bacterium]